MVTNMGNISFLRDSCQNCINIAKLLYRNQKVNQHFPLRVSSLLFCRINSVCQGSVSYVSQLSRATRKRSREL